MAMNWGARKTPTITFATHTTLTPSVDLGWNYEFLRVFIPTIESSTVTVHVSYDDTNFYPIYMFDTDATGAYAEATTAAVTSLSIIFRIGGTRYIKIKCGSAQGSNRIFQVWGFNR